MGWLLLMYCGEGEAEEVSSQPKKRRRSETIIPIPK